MAKNTYKIEIKGSGTKKEIIKALEGLIASLHSTDGKQEDALLDGAEWEDKTLMTNISAE